MEEKKSELLIKISVDTTELDAAIEKIKLLNSLYQEKNIMKILSTAQQTKERLKEIDVDQFANELVKLEGWALFLRRLLFIRNINRRIELF